MKNQYVFIGLPSILFIAFLGYLTNCGENKRVADLDSKYKVLHRDSVFIGEVQYTSPFLGKGRKGALYISTTNGEGIMAISNALPANTQINNKNVNKMVLMNFLEPGDSIYKPAGKDSLIVFKEKQRYIYPYLFKMK